MRGLIAPRLPIIMQSKANTLYKSIRAEITVAFLVPVVMLGLACAVNTGLPISWENAYLGAALIFFLVVLSNGLNNIVDKKIDTAAISAGNEKSGMYHFLDGTPRGGILSVIMLSGICVLCMVGTLVSRTGYPVIFFALFGMIMALEYNLPPLKLAYHPFPEITMLLPSAVVAVTGVQYILVSQVTPIAVYMGTAFGLFSATWFLWQSMIDYDTDKAGDKKTTPVYMGPLSAGVIGITYPIVGVGVLILGMYTGLPLYKPAILGIVCTLIIIWTMVCFIPNAFKVWTGTMAVAFVFGVTSALAIIIGGC